MIVCVLAQSCPVQFSATLWALADQALLSMGFSWQEYGVGCHFLLQWIFHMQGSNLSWQANCLLLSHRLQIAFCMCVCVRVCVRVCVCVLVAQSCPPLCDPMDCSPPGSSAHGIFQTRIQNAKALQIHGLLKFKLVVISKGTLRAPAWWPSL